ncbi:UDP-N-acetylglucosamine transferase subunit ALG14 homolog isoform X2 [Syngnathus typhle]|uniref:UDP-N-acetylglucosamine transferase subunit ALG14 homolog isoform X2 n=1 Tax=Syngnathus typhle TaxID=161592 RepID=UPI002A6AE6C6|nr:UDP-N-acetylglucosamine transferase subunit ALG14 homolog isoform X2 [Syngnathus typhle]
MTVLLGCSFILVACLLLIRLYIVVRNGRNSKLGNKGRIGLLVVAGSGGHTTEILRLMKSLSSAYSPRFYIIADTDTMSEERIRAFEKSKQILDCDPQFTIHRIPRSREVHQSWSSSVLSTLNAQFYAIPLIFRLRPDMVLCNGPGTCVPLCLGGLLLGIVGIKKVMIVFVESLCRVESLSLTGKILYHVSDFFFVQWASLRNSYPKSIFLGRIV